jgi:uncharacterized protein (TIGR03067 family)
MRLVFNAVFAAGLLLCSGEPQRERLPGKGELEGEWAVVVWDFNGFWFTAVDGQIGDHYRDLRFTFTNNKMQIKLRDGGQSLGWWGWDWVDSPYKLDSTKSPKEIDIDQMGRHGVYVVRGDKLVLCLAPHDSRMPTTFELKPKEGDVLLLLERVKNGSDASEARQRRAR